MAGVEGGHAPRALPEFTHFVVSIELGLNQDEVYWLSRLADVTGSGAPITPEMQNIPPRIRGMLYVIQTGPFVIMADPLESVREMAREVGRIMKPPREGWQDGDEDQP